MNTSRSCVRSAVSLSLLCFLLSENLKVVRRQSLSEWGMGMGFEVPTSRSNRAREPDRRMDRNSTTDGDSMNTERSNLIPPFGGMTEVNNVRVVKADAINRTILRQPTARGRLRRDWSHNPPLSKSARLIRDHQSNCSLPVQTFHLDNSFGIGSHLALWSQGICNAMEASARLRTHNPDWLWLDQTLCDPREARKSPWLCYFPHAEYLCHDDDDDDDDEGEDEDEDEDDDIIGGNNKRHHANASGKNVSDPRDLKRHQCSFLKHRAHDSILREFRAASTEVMFSRVSPLVIREAERQVGLLFGNGATVPPDMIAVHVRWGDKFWEMDLANCTEYVHAVERLRRRQLAEGGREDNDDNDDDDNDDDTAGSSSATAGPTAGTTVFIATEDPRVRRECSGEFPSDWNVLWDRTIDELGDFRPKRGNRASHMSKNSRGRAGLVALGSLLLAMEARYFVLTTKSNWSRIMDHLRTNVIDPRCQNCTRMVDLRPGVW